MPLFFVLLYKTGTKAFCTEKCPALVQSGVNYLQPFAVGQAFAVKQYNLEFVILSAAKNFHYRKIESVLREILRFAQKDIVENDQ